jgi:Tc5 transposase DNA-binding domain
MPRKNSQATNVNKRKKPSRRNQTVKRNRNSYSIKQKKEVVDYAKQHGRNKAACHFGLDATMVGRWVKASSGWATEINQNSRRVGSGRKAFYPEAEKKLYDWIIEQRKQGLVVTYATVRVKMLDILREDNAVEDFKTSDNWLSAFMKRYKLAWRRRTRISQKLPAQTEELLERFRQFIIRLRIQKSFELHNIFNMDETPVWFDMAGNFTINQKGEKTVHIRATGNEKNRFTVVLTCSAGKNFNNFSKIMIGNPF